MPAYTIVPIFGGVSARPAAVPTLSCRVNFMLKSGPSSNIPTMGIETDLEKTIRVEIHEARAELSYAPGGGPQNPVPLATGFPLVESWTTLSLENEGMVDLLFPLNQSTVKLIEILRGGKRPSFRITVKPTGLIRYERTLSVGPPGTKSKVDRVVEPFLGFGVPVWRRDSQSIVLDVPRDQWADDILPVLGLGRWKIYEVPVTDSKPLAEVDAHIDAAMRHFDRGEWRSCVASARDAIQHSESHLSTAAKTHFSIKESNGTITEAGPKVEEIVARYADLVSAMLAFQGKVFTLFSAGDHPQPANVGLERPDAEFALSIALDCRRYVGARFAQD